MEQAYSIGSMNIRKIHSKLKTLELIIFFQGGRGQARIGIITAGRENAEEVAKELKVFIIFIPDLNKPIVNICRLSCQVSEHAMFHGSQSMQSQKTVVMMKWPQPWS